MKRAFLVHGWEGSPEEGWRPWLKSNLEQSGFQVFAPAMPGGEYPKEDAWVEHLARAVRTPDSECYFVGHSLGCIAILRYLETLREDQGVGGAVLVAGFSSDLGYEELANFFNRPIAWEEVALRCPRFIAIHSDNDPFVSLHYGDMFKTKLGAEVVIEHGKKHFSGEDGITELPSALNAVLKLSQGRA